MSEKKPGRPPKQGDKKSTRSVYCTEFHHAILRDILRLPDDKLQYLRGWLDRGANIGGKK